MATAHPAKFASGTPSLSKAGLYYRDVEGDVARPVAPPSSAGASSTSPAVLPVLPPQLRGLSTRPRQGATVANSVDAIKAYVDALSVGSA